MTMKEFEKKYDINFDGCFVYDAILKLSHKFKSIPKGERDDFTKDFMTIKIY